MSLRKINDTDFDLDVYSPSSDSDHIVGSVYIEIDKEGITMEGELLSWQQIAKARDSLGLVSFTDEEFQAWASANNYAQKLSIADPVKHFYLMTRLDAMEVITATMQATMSADVFDKLTRIYDYLMKTYHELQETA